MAILRDKTLDAAQIRQRLTASFTQSQKDLVQNQQLRLRQTREDFRKTLTREQRQILQERIDKIRNTKDRGELRDGPRNTNGERPKNRVRGN
ncbi:MAG: hypothetical protein HC798_01035 [Polaribacter sp.]|nr:hypothetical protein [Polaribacter sp.]